MQSYNGITHSRKNMNELDAHTATWMKQYLEQEGRHKRIYTKDFHLYESIYLMYII